MKDNELAIQQLLATSRIAFLATTGSSGAEASMAPFAIWQGHVLLHLSALAKHHRNIQSNPQCGCMICTPEEANTSPLALPRLSLQGSILPVASNELQAAKAAYLQAIPDAAPLFDFADFQLFKLTPTSIQWIGGFGKARKIPFSAWQTLC